MKRVNYLGKDYNTILNEIVDFIKFKHPEYTNIFESDLGMMLIEAISYGLDTIGFYLDKQISELYLDTAIDKKNIERIARQIGYKLQPASSSTTYVTIQFQDDYDFDVIFYQGFKFYAGGGLTFTVDIDTKASKPRKNSILKIPVREGVINQEFFIGSGLKNQTYTLFGIPNGKYISNPIRNLASEIIVSVDNENWDLVDFISPSDEKVFEIEYSNPPILRFGGYDNQIPPAGSNIRVKYMYCSGTKGRVTANAITSSDSLFINNTKILFKIIGSDNSSGGTDLESSDEIKRKVPYFYQTRNLAITQKDFNYVISDVLGVKKGLAVSLRDELGSLPAGGIINEIDYINSSLISYLENKTELKKADIDYISEQLNDISTDIASLKENLNEVINNDCMANVVEIYVLEEDSSGNYVSPSTYLINSVRSRLEDIIEPTVDIIVYDGLINTYLVDLTVEIEILAGYNYAVITDNVIKSIKNYFKALNFGDNLYLGNLYQLIEGTEGIDHSFIRIDNVWYNAKLEPNLRTKRNELITNEGVKIKKTELLALGNLIVNVI
jgi:hypothetical protein